MKIAVCGLWHLGAVTAACVAKNFTTVGYDPSVENIEKLSRALPAVAEPGLAELISQGFAAKKLSFTNSGEDAVRDADIIWVAFDTPVDENDVADVEYVLREVKGIFPAIKDGAVVLVSSQLPVGTTAKLEKAFAAVARGRAVSFAYSPENLRLGKALEVFQRPDRIVIGVRNETAKQKLLPLLSPYSEKLEWMGVESAEMVKHSINAFLATSVCFINEIATICEKVGADAKEVERGLKTEQRIGPKAYLGAGGAFSGGTLARDITFLSRMSGECGIAASVFSAVRASNQAHKSWGVRKIEEVLGVISGRQIAVLGLTYKPGTDTLRRSAAIETCKALAERGARITAYDPAVKDLPGELKSVIDLKSDIYAAIRGSHALYVGTEWPEFKSLSGRESLSAMAAPIVVDQSRFLEAVFAGEPAVRYSAIGIQKGK